MRWLFIVPVRTSPVLGVLILLMIAGCGDEAPAPSTAAPPAAMADSGTAVLYAGFEDLTRKQTLGKVLGVTFESSARRLASLPLLDASQAEAARAELGLDAKAPLEHEGALAMARQVGADAVLVGRVTEITTAYALTATVLSAEDGQVLLELTEMADDAQKALPALQVLVTRLGEQWPEALTSLGAP